MPPLSEVVDALTNVVLPAALATAVVFALAARWTPGRRGVVAAALALGVGFVAGNHFRGAVEYRLDSEKLLTAADLARALRDSFVPPTDEEAPIPPAPRYWIPWTAGLALLGGLVARTIPPAAAWPLRAAIAGLAAALAVAADVRQSIPWLAPSLFAIILAEWTLLEQLGRSERDDEATSPAGRGLVIVAPLAACATFLAASVVLLHAHSGVFVDIATIMAACLGTLTVVAWLMKADPSGAAPGAAVVLPALMLSGQQDTFSEVPNTSFALIAVAPLALMPLLWRRLRESHWWTAGVLTSFVGVLAIGTALAVRAESLSFY